jgi:hypothetical protein
MILQLCTQESRTNQLARHATLYQAGIGGRPCCSVGGPEARGRPHGRGGVGRRPSIGHGVELWARRSDALGAALPGERSTWVPWWRQWDIDRWDGGVVQTEGDRARGSDNVWWGGAAASDGGVRRGGNGDDWREGDSNVRRNSDGDGGAPANFSNLTP